MGKQGQATSARNFASSFLQTDPRGPALAIR